MNARKQKIIKILTLFEFRRKQYMSLKLFKLQETFMIDFFETVIPV